MQTKLITLVAALSMTGCAHRGNFDFEGFGDAMMGISQDYAEQSNANYLATQQRLAVPMNQSKPTYQPYVPGPIQTPSGTLKCGLIDTAAPGVQKKICWKE